MSDAMKKHFDTLGRRAIDKVTRFEGIITSLSFDLYGCVQYALSPPIDKDGKYQDSGRWFDAHRLDVLMDDPVMTPPDFFQEYKAPMSAPVGPAEKEPPR